MMLTVNYIVSTYIQMDSFSLHIKLDQLCPQNILSVS